MPERKSLRQKSRKGVPSRGWVTARKLTQYIALLTFLALFVGSRPGGAGGDLMKIPMQLDPLTSLAHILANRVILAGSLLALITLTLTLVFGRAWCGWLCPLGTILDLLSLNRWRRKDQAPSETWRTVKYGFFLVILVAALLGNLTLLAFDPLTLLIRTLTTSLWPALDQIVTAGEMALYRLPPLAGPISQLDSWLRPRILPSQPVYYRQIWLFTGVFLGVIALNLAAPRFWCRYLCPLGGLLGLVSKVAVLRRSVGEGCKGCVLCTAACPTGTINPSRGYTSDPGECTMCLDCLDVCPRDEVTFAPHILLADWNNYDPGRRQALLSVAGAIAAVALFESDSLAKREHPYLLRPPGARGNDFISKCIRCGECMHACPTSALQPAIIESGLEGLWTPVLIPRLGYCDYSCNACGPACPVEAIPPLSLEGKRKQVIGKAYIDEHRCIAWADHRDCIVCEEMCPLPEKAIWLEATQVLEASGEMIAIQLPRVLRDQCIGCGICEYKCPVSGEAAIRVYVPDQEHYS